MPASNRPWIGEVQWIAFVDEISRRLETEETVVLMHSVLAGLFHFERPFYAELVERAQKQFLPFNFDGEHWYANGEPARIVFHRRKVAPRRGVARLC